MAKPFFQVTLRTSDVEAATAFYTSVLGPHDLDIVKLHEEAVARGARPHWLGFIDVGDVDASAALFLARGATALGTKWVNPKGLEASVLRDPGGALVAFANPHGPPRPSGVEITRYVLNTPDVEKAKKNYADILGWTFGEPRPFGRSDVVHPFSWDDLAKPAGAFFDIADRPRVHPHWLFHFRVASLDVAVDALMANGGTVAGAVSFPGGGRIAVCDDPQGAAFAMEQAGV